MGTKVALFTISAILYFANFVCAAETVAELSDRVFSLAKIQSLAMLDSLEKEGKVAMPKSVKNGKLETSGITWWCSGFFPGTLWYIYEYGKDENIRENAMRLTKALEPLILEKTPTDHDIGFQINCSYGNAYRLTKDESLVPVIVAAADKLSKRFNPKVGVIKSWNWKEKYPVIIDNMMNLELLCKASQISSKSKYADIAKSHADTTIAKHFRTDGSSFHVVLYDLDGARASDKLTWQGLSDSSAWARGQAWALYGYTMMYRETKEKRYLKQAEKVAGFILNHKNLPSDKIPLWDFDAPKDALRDASAGAIMSSALLDLHKFTKDSELSKQCLDTAEIQIRTLAGDGYLAEAGTNCNFILKHSVGSLPHKSEVDSPLSYADYYFLEAILKLRTLKN